MRCERDRGDRNAMSGERGQKMKEKTGKTTAGEKDEG
jgi:hypothetical protein